MVRGNTTKYVCKCGGRIRRTIMEAKLVCNKCNQDYGFEKDLKECKFKILDNKWWGKNA